MILFPKIPFAVSIALGSYALIFAPSDKSLFIIVIDGASLISFVFGLNANPQTAMVLLFIIVALCFKKRNCKINFGNFN